MKIESSGGPVLWSPRSQDLTKVDFYLWGHVKNIVYQAATTTALDMRQRK